MSLDGGGDIAYDLAIIEFDDQGTFWKLDQLEDTLDLIERRNAETERGILVLPFVHGWKNNADPNQKEGDLVDFREELAAIADLLASGDKDSPDRVIGVYLGWRGATSRIPLQQQTTFFDRRRTAERVASLNMRETLFRILIATNANSSSKAFVVGHSMGGIVVGRTLQPDITTLLLSEGRNGIRLTSALTVLINPALDALASHQFIDFLKRSNARVEVRHADGRVEPVDQPIMVSIQTEVDTATGRAYPAGRIFATLFNNFRGDHAKGAPSRRTLVTRAEGHVPYLVSHDAWIEDGELRLERVPGAWNDTPYWVIRVTKDISKDHGDTRNPRLGELVDRIARGNRLYDTDAELWMRVSREK
ncbi:MAG: hypothetical protein AAGD32_10410 [Planctomycetota bacterium]